MSDLPKGWEWARLGELADTSLGKMLDKKQATGLDPTPYLRNVNVRWGTFDLSDLASMDIRPEELDRVLAQSGDVIACEGGEPGRSAVWRGLRAIALQKALHRIRPTGALSPEYLAHLLHHLALSRRLEVLFTGTTIKHLPQEKLRVVPVPLPPINEQERIVAAIEEHLSRLDAGARGLVKASDRCEAAIAPTIRHYIGAAGSGRRMRLGDLGAWSSGGTPKASLSEYYDGDIPWAVIGDLTDGAVSRTARTITSLGLNESTARIIPAGSVLVAMYGSIGKLGIPAIDMATNQAIACISPDPSLVDRDFLFWLLRSLRPTLIQMGKGAAQQNIGQGLLKALEVNLPSLGDQRLAVQAIEAAAVALARLRSEADLAGSRSAALRRSILAAAFSGKLVPQDPDDEPASALLDRIRAERAAAPAPKRRSARSSA